MLLNTKIVNAYACFFVYLQLVLIDKMLFSEQSYQLSDKDYQLLREASEPDPNHCHIDELLREIGSKLTPLIRQKIYSDGDHGAIDDKSTMADTQKRLLDAEQKIKQTLPIEHEDWDPSF